MNIINDKEIEFYKIIINNYKYWIKRFLKILYYYIYHIWFTKKNQGNDFIEIC